MINSLSDTIIPWLLGGLVLITLITGFVTVKSWREAKRSPYFFLRVQAAKKMQRYLVASLLLILVTIATSAYAWQAPQETAHHIARLNHAKPPSQPAVRSQEPELEAESSPTAVEISLSPISNRTTLTPLELGDTVLERELPAEYNQYTPSAELSEATDIGEIAFSTEISDEYQAVDPGRRFSKGFFTLYATFDYDRMLDGLSWSWVWRLNGQVIDGGNQMWTYGDDGPGYVYFQPEEGFQLGEYSLEVWVNETLMAQSSFMVTDSISANN